MSKEEENFEEIELDDNTSKEQICNLKPNFSVIETEDNKSEKTNYTNAITQGSNQIRNSLPQSNNNTSQNSSQSQPQSKFYLEFIESNKEFFERIGFKDISNDPIFELPTEVEMKKNVNTNSCEICKKEISRIFSKPKYCKFCGCILCDKCSTLKRKIPLSNEEKLSLICLYCENKFINFQSHEDFKDKLTRKEFEITEYNQKLEKLSLIYSEQLDEINKLNETIYKKKRENETKEEVLRNETNNLKIRSIEMCDNSEKITKKINEEINSLKKLDEKKKNLEKDYANIQKDREDITFEYEKKQSHLDDIFAKINQLSMSIKNREQKAKQEKEKFKEKELQTVKKETGNKQLDMLLKEKMKSQKKLLEEAANEETTIIINPSKVMKEIYKEPLLGVRNEETQTEGVFKKFIMYMGSKIFIKE